MNGKAVFPLSLNVIHVNAVCVAHVTVIICRSEEY